MDAGCGVGGTSIYLAKKLGCKVVGITLSQKQVDAAVKNARKQGPSDRTQFIAMDFEAIDFSDAYFDVVLGIESICHACNKQKFIEEAYRVLKADGRLIVADGFASKEHSTPEENNVMQRWLSGWRVNFLETEDNFKKFAENV